MIWMDNRIPVLISEIKHQGTNDERKKEGKPKQATGMLLNDMERT